MKQRTNKNKKHKFAVGDIVKISVRFELFSDAVIGPVYAIVTACPGEEIRHVAYMKKILNQNEYQVEIQGYPGQYRYFRENDMEKT